MMQPDNNQTWDPGGDLRQNLRSTICAIAASLDAQNANDPSVESRTDLDSHANMPVVGRNCFILAETGKTVDVSPFSPDNKLLVAQILDAAIQYNDPFFLWNMIL